MTQLKTIAKDTAIYGISSIVGRLLNYMLTPLYTIHVFSAASGDYGVISNIYAHTALLLVLLTFGMETTFFRFMNKEEENPERVLSTTLLIVGVIGLIFVATMLTFLQPISTFLGYARQPQYILMMTIIVATDAFQSILFSYLRYQRKAMKFMGIKLAFIITNIALNLAFFVLLPKLYVQYPDVIGTFYNPHVGVGYVFGLNMVCTLACTCFFFPELSRFKPVFDPALIKRMLKYSWPILILGIAGILNQTFDKQILPRILGKEEGDVQLGIYSACAKVAMIMVMIMQAFRYAYEPIVFSQAKEKDNKEMYASTMKFFIIFTLLAFLMVMGYIDLLKRVLIGQDYWEGLFVVPIVMAAEILMGIYFNLSFWYKLIDKTLWGALFSGIGCAVLILVNVIFIPRYGYAACAWAGVAGYGTAMLLSYFVGQKKYPIAYPLRSIFGYVALAALLYAVMTLIPAEWNIVGRIAMNTLLILLFVAYLVKHDFPLSRLPLIGRYVARK